MKLPEIKLSINGVEYDNTFNDDVKIDRTDIDTECEEQPTKYAYYAFLAEEADNICDIRKAEFEHTEAVLDAEKREQARQMTLVDPKFKFTETMCENSVKTDPRYIEAQNKMFAARLLSGQLRVCQRAFEQRKDMIVSIGQRIMRSGVPTRILEQQEEDVRQIIGMPKDLDAGSVGVESRRRQPKKG